MRKLLPFAAAFGLGVLAARPDLRAKARFAFEAAKGFLELNWEEGQGNLGDGELGDGGRSPWSRYPAGTEERERSQSEELGIMDQTRDAFADLRPDGNRPFSVDDFQFNADGTTNNVAVLGLPGSGKSHWLDAQIREHIDAGRAVVIFDPLNDHRELTAELGGTTIDLADPKTIFNPFELLDPNINHDSAGSDLFGVLTAWNGRDLLEGQPMMAQILLRGAIRALREADGDAPFTLAKVVKTLRTLDLPTNSQSEAESLTSLRGQLADAIAALGAGAFKRQLSAKSTKLDLESGRLVRVAFPPDLDTLAPGLFAGLAMAIDRAMSEIEAKKVLIVDEFERLTAERHAALRPSFEHLLPLMRHYDTAMMVSVQAFEQDAWLARWLRNMRRLVVLRITASQAEWILDELLERRHFPANVFELVTADWRNPTWTIRGARPAVLVDGSEIRWQTIIIPGDEEDAN